MSFDGRLPGVVMNRWGLLSVALFACGCGGKYGQVAEIVDVVPAAGTVTFEGKPLPDYSVTFNHSDGKRTAIGKTNAEGKFTLGTNKADDGAPPGKHTVTVAFAAPEPDINDTPIDDPKKLPKASIVIPSKYADPAKSNVSVTIPDSGDTNIKIELKK